MMDSDAFFVELPKVELHAHLNGSLSSATMLQLKRYHADCGIEDKTNAFFDEFQIGAGDTRSLSDCFQVFSIAHSLTSTPETLALATRLTLQEFQDDGCCYLELRSTPRDTPYMTKSHYIETIIKAIRKSSVHLSMITKLIISINRNQPLEEADEIAKLAIECFKKYPENVVGIELSGDPMAGKFESFVPALTKARDAGLKVTLHCGEVCNPKEVLEMLKFKPDRIGHGVCIHPKYGGTDETWTTLCKLKIPVEVCLTSNVNTKSTPDYDSHHFQYLHEAEIPIILCTDDKGVFATSLSREYQICVKTFAMTYSQAARLSLNACQYVFADNTRKMLNDKILNFIEKHSL
ncbi:adenosine deaminase-like protein [Trichoplusia ni]|uniref:Adenosine deaminase-like protein n=1 Tax=Trichoplusia ni TaxID=7111 RepID=A0A7E5WZS7_TRINI|nr:adenosine deaminase-like protein [Trichoplusia ni]